MTSKRGSVEELQEAFCHDQGAPFVASPPESKLGVALSTMDRLPINGLRHPVAGDTNGWYIWGGETFSTEPDFFASVHASHLYEEHPELGKLLGLSPGHRFLLAGDQLDVWHDPSLLNV